MGIQGAMQNAGELQISDPLPYSVSIVTAADRTEDIPLECMLEIDEDDSKTIIVAQAGQ